MSDEKKKMTISTKLSQVNQAYLPLIEDQLVGNSIEFSEYSRRCVLNAISAINICLDNAGVQWSDKQLDQSNITSILLNVASLELNASADPSEVYFQIRNVKRKGADGKDEWVKKVEMNIQGDGNDAILARFGRGVKKVFPYWLVREGDLFEYPKFNGLEMSPPKWEPKGTGKVIRVVYPILHDDNTVHFYISEREDVARNLMAHINNNLMNETFGIAKDRYNATAEQKKQIDAKKAVLKDKARELGLDAINDEELSAYISPSWKEDFSQESMIIRKMRNNITKKIPKDFGSSLAQESFLEVTDDRYKIAKENIVEGTATVVVEDIAEDEAVNRAIDKETGEIKGELPSKEKDAPESKLEGREKPDFT